MDTVTMRSLVSLALKLMGLCVLVGLILQGSRIWRWASASIRDSEPLVGTVIGVGSTLVYPFLFAGLAIFVIRYADGISERLIKKDNKLHEIPFHAIKTVENLVFVGIGIVFVVRAFPQLVELMVKKWQLHGHGTEGLLVAGLFRRGIEMLVGGVLVMRSRTVSGWIRNREGREIQDERSDESKS